MIQKEFPDQVYLGEIWPRKGIRFSEAGGRFSRCHISRVNLFFSFFLGPDAEGPPERYVKKNSGRKRSERCFLLFPRFWSFFVPSLGQKREGIPFLGLCPFFIICSPPEIVRVDQ